MSNSTASALCSPACLRDRDGYYRLPFAAMQEVGSAAITLGLVLDVIDEKAKTTFMSVQNLAECAAIPATTVKRHLARLCSAGWLDNQGRQPGRGSQRKRRTATYALTAKTRARAKAIFAAWPKWLASWSSWISHTHSLVYAVLLSRACLVECIEEEGTGSGEERLPMTNTEIRQATGLSRNTIQYAIEVLTDPRHPLIEQAESGGYNMLLPDLSLTT